MPGFIRSAAGAAAALALLAGGLAACGSSGGGSKAPSTPATSGTGHVTSYASLSGTSTTITLAPAFVQTLARLKVAPTAVAPATTTGSTFTFPITSGKATVNAPGSTPPAVGTLVHSGGLALATGSLKVSLNDVVLTLGTTSTIKGAVSLNGSALGGAAITLFDVDLSRLSTVTGPGGTTTLTGAVVYVDPGAATALNAAFGLSGANALPTGTDKFTVGTATVKLTGK
jgi:hypothetical protein